MEIFGGHPSAAIRHVACSCRKRNISEIQSDLDLSPAATIYNQDRHGDISERFSHQGSAVGS